MSPLAPPGRRRAAGVAPPGPEPLTADAARRKLGQRVVVQFPVRGGDVNSFEGHVELFSTPSWRDANCPIVRILKDDLSRFAPRGDRALLDSFRGKEVRVRGSVQPNPVNVGDRPIIEVVR